MAIVNQILKVKGADVCTVTPDMSIYDALQLMAEYNIGAVPVLSEGKLAGIFSERDFARQSVSREKLSITTPVEELMTKQVSCVHADQTVEGCMALMTDKHIRHLPVINEQNELIGIVSIGDLVKSIMSQQKFLIQQLEEYIVSSG